MFYNSVELPWMPFQPGEIGNFVHFWERFLACIESVASTREVPDRHCNFKRHRLSLQL